VDGRRLELPTSALRTQRKQRSKSSTKPLPCQVLAQKSKEAQIRLAAAYAAAAPFTFVPTPVSSLMPPDGGDQTHIVRGELRHVVS
jgi:hypothetical protein